MAHQHNTGHSVP